MFWLACSCVHHMRSEHLQEHAKARRLEPPPWCPDPSDPVTPGHAKALEHWLMRHRKVLAWVSLAALAHFVIGAYRDSVSMRALARNT